MLSTRAIKVWSWLHKWTSLVCTAFMLLLCLTGLPLIFHHEIGHLLGTEVEAPAMPAESPRASMDTSREVGPLRASGMIAAAPTVASELHSDQVKDLTYN